MFLPFFYYVFLLYIGSRLKKYYHIDDLMKNLTVKEWLAYNNCSANPISANIGNPKWHL